jgi:outer membrane protein OmpA-like peptidoglycan-associated protein
MNAPRPNLWIAIALCLWCMVPSGARAAQAEPADTEALPVLPGRPLDSRSHEPRGIGDLQQRLDQLGAADSQVCEDAYAAHKAQAWLNFAKYAAAAQLPHAVQVAALANSATLAQILEQHSGSALDTPELPGARHIREDLWRSVAAVKGDGRLCAAPKMTAYCEVQLAWAGYEAASGGWRHVDPYVRIAEDYCDTAASAVPEPEPTLEVPADTLSPSDNEVQSQLVASVVFGHNRARRSQILPPGREDLRHLVARVKPLGPHTVFLISAHADVTGHTDYNKRLSAQRARSVALELRSLGIPSGRIRTEALGSSRPIVHCPADAQALPRPKYLGCLEPNRRVVVTVLIPKPQK